MFGRLFLYKCIIIYDLMTKYAREARCVKCFEKKKKYNEKLHTSKHIMLKMLPFKHIMT